MTCVESIRTALSTWDAIQVELQGRYSLPRLREILSYGQQTSTAKNLLIVLLSPLPGLLLLIFMDALPLSEPDEGIHHQTAALYFRVFVCGWIMAFMMAMQLHQAAPTLPLSTMRLWTISISVGLMIIAGLHILGLLIGFPTPFVEQLLTPVWLVSFISGLWMSWKSAFRNDTEARANLTRYIQVFGAQIVIVPVYTAYGITFGQVSADSQAWVSLILPVMKIFFKNWMSRGVYHMEDLAPSTIVFNVDVYHGMFVASTMQQSQTNATTAMVMLVDIGQSCVAYWEMHTILLRVNRLAASCQKLDSSSHSELQPAEKQDPRRLSSVVLKLGVVDYALHVIDTRPRIRNHPDICHARHLRPANPQSDVVPVFPQPQRTGVKGPRIQPETDSLKRNAQDKTTHSIAEHQADEQEGSTAVAIPPPLHSKLAQEEQMQLECVKCVLKMLHMIEFYVLIEFVEVIIAAIYTVYMWALSHLPNRQYYSHLKGKSHDEIMAMVTRLAIYTSLELLSFIVFCVIVDRKLRHISSIQILAFVLQKHMRMVQTTLSMWVFFVVQLTFEHFGTDYTFQFKWLRGEGWS